MLSDKKKPRANKRASWYLWFDDCYRFFYSANSKRLTQLSLDRNKNSYQVTCSQELNEAWFSDIKSVGISAGASTPDELIHDVINKVKTFSKIKVKETTYE